MHNIIWKRGVRKCERNNCADTKVSEEGGGGGAPGARAEIPMCHTLFINKKLFVKRMSQTTQVGCPVGGKRSELCRAGAVGHFLHRTTESSRLEKTLKFI